MHAHKTHTSSSYDNWFRFFCVFLLLHGGLSDSTVGHVVFLCVCIFSTLAGRPSVWLFVMPVVGTSAAD